MKQKISNRERHIRWNWEQSPSNGTDFRYLFRSYDVNQRPDMIDWTRLGASGERAKRDTDLRERTKGSIENYVAGIYEGK